MTSPTRPMRLRVMSDLHVELAAFEPPPVSAEHDGFDAVVLAGDIHNGPAALVWARQAFPHHRIVQIAGNHEFYDQRYHACLDALRETALTLEIDFLENETRMIDGVQFVGCTLWTDYRVFERPGRAHVLSQQQAMAATRGLMADHRAISITGVPDCNEPAAAARRFEPADGLNLHQASREFLHRTLCMPASAPRVVVTHHLPSWRSVHAAYEHSVTNAAFCSDLDALLPHASLWVHGHTHASVDWSHAGCRVLCNPRGYPRRARPGVFENSAFRPDLVVPVTTDLG